MKVFSFMETVAEFHRLVLRECTGNADDFARRLGISRPSLYRLMGELSDMGIPVEYCRERRTYRYVHPDRVEISIIIRPHECS